MAEVRISRTELGEETLQLAEDGILDASAGFCPIPPDGERWETRNRCRIVKGWLAHIAMTPDPAYETANVLAVRSRPERPRPHTPTPLLDKLELDRWRAVYADIDRRYNLGQ